MEKDAGNTWRTMTGIDGEGCQEQMEEDGDNGDDGGQHQALTDSR